MTKKKEKLLEKIVSCMPITETDVSPGPSHTKDGPSHSSTKPWPSNTSPKPGPINTPPNIGPRHIYLDDSRSWIIHPKF